MCRWCRAPTGTRCMNGRSPAAPCTCRWTRRICAACGECACRAARRGLARRVVGVPGAARGPRRCLRRAVRQRAVPGGARAARLRAHVGKRAGGGRDRDAGDLRGAGAAGRHRLRHGRHHAKAGAVHGGRPLVTGSALVGGHDRALPIRIPMTDIFELGTGGDAGRRPAASRPRCRPRAARCRKPRDVLRCARRTEPMKHRRERQ